MRKQKEVSVDTIDAKMASGLKKRQAVSEVLDSTLSVATDNATKKVKRK